MKWWFKIWKFIVIAAAVIMVWNDFNYEYDYESDLVFYDIWTNDYDEIRYP